MSKIQPTVKFEPPPFASPDFEEGPNDPGFGWWHTHTCAKRQGLGLLLVNKHIHQEASSIFWDNAIFCYRKPHHVTHDLVHLPNVWPKIRSLSFMNFREDEGRDVLLSGNGMMRVLAKMPNLQEIELQASYLRQHCMPRFLDLQSLKRLRVLELRATYMAFEKPWEQRVYTALARKFEMPRCEDPIHAADRDDDLTV